MPPARPAAPAAPPHVVYISGAGRSGSTLVERMLGSQDGFVNVGEVAFFFSHGVLRNENCGCGQPFLECPFWSAVVEQAFGSVEGAEAERVQAAADHAIRQRRAWSLLTGRGPASWKSSFDVYVGAFDRIYRAIAEVSGAGYVVDASKQGVHGLAMTSDRSAPWHVLQLMRDPRGVAFSWGKAGVARPHSRGERLTMRRYTPVQVARRWSMEHTLGWLLRRRRRGTSALVRYEEFVRRPGTTITAAERAAGLPDDGSLLAADRGAIELQASHALAGNPNRFRTGEVVIRSDDTWRTEMPARDQRLVYALTRPAWLLNRWRL